MQPYKQSENIISKNTCYFTLLDSLDRILQILKNDKLLLCHITTYYVEFQPTIYVW